MKKEIEKKLGCTIEEYVKKLSAYFEKYRNYEIEHASFFSMLTNEELDFLTTYIEAKIHK